MPVGTRPSPEQILSIESFGTKLVKFRSLYNIFSSKIMYLKLTAKCSHFFSGPSVLTHWGLVTHVCVSKLASIGSDNGLLPGRRQATIRTNAGSLGTSFDELLIEIQTFSLTKMHLKMLSGKWWPFCLSPNVLKAPNYWSASCVVMKQLRPHCKYMFQDY